MTLWTDNEIVHLSNYDGEYLNKDASKRFYDFYKDILSIEYKDSYILLDYAKEVTSNNPCKKEEKEIYRIEKVTKPITSSKNNKIKCTMLMGIGIIYYLNMVDIENKSVDKVINNLTKTYNMYVSNNEIFSEIVKKVPDFKIYFESIKK